MPAPCMMAWFGNGGSNVAAWPASVPIVSTPTPRTSRSCARSSDARLSKPGLCGPSVATFRKAAVVGAAAPAGAQQDPRFGRNQPELRLPFGNAFGGEQEVGFVSTSRVTSMTHAGPTSRRAGIVSQVLSIRSLPVTQWTGASKCVPVCSPNLSVFQVPRRPLVVVARDDLDRDTGRRREHRRQADHRRVGAERLREIDDVHAAVGEGIGEIEKDGRHQWGIW